MTIHLNCNACSAPLETDGSAATIRCPYCDSTVVVPPALRPAGADFASRGAAPPPVPGKGGLPAARRSSRRRPVESSLIINAAPASRGKGCLALVVLFIALALVAFSLLMAGLPLRAWRSFTTSTSNTAIVVPPELQNLRPPHYTTPVPATPAGFATELARFGSEGIGPGYFDDARAIAVDNQGRIFVGEYVSGRVQVLDEAGKFQAQWNFPKDSWVGAFAVDRQSRLHAAVKQELEQYDAQTGALLATLTKGSDAWAGGGIAIAPDGRIVFELEDDIVRLAADGSVDLRIRDAVQEASGTTNIGVALAVDGLGNIFALAITQDVVYKFAPDGRFIDRFGERDRSGATGQGQFSAASSIAIDPQGRVYVGDIGGVQVFDNGGRFLDVIDIDGFPFGLVFDDAGELLVVARDHVARFRINGPTE